MKFHVSKDLFFYALKKASSVISSKSTLPILSNVYLCVKENKLILRTTDLELSIKTTIDVTVEEEGDITVPCKKLFEIVTKLPFGTVLFETDENYLAKIKCSESEFNIFGTDEKEFPIESELDNSRTFIFKKADFSKTLRKIYYAASTDDSRYVLNGVLMSVRGNTFTFVATDGRRLALVEKEINEDYDIDGDVILPIKVVIELFKILGTEGDVSIKLGEVKASFVTEDTVLTTKFIDGNYPNFRHVIPEVFSYMAVIPRYLFMEALERMSIVVDEADPSISMKLEEKVATLLSSSKVLGKSTEPTEISFDGPEMVISFNPKYFYEPLKNMDCDEFVIKINDPDTPLALTGDEDFMYMIMPLRS